VPVLSRISNHTDFDALRLHPQVNLQFVSVNQDCPPADLIILPGSKNVRADLASLHAAGWKEHLQHHLRYGGKLIGICGGYQMLGEIVHDPDGIEDVPGSTDGFSLINMSTILEAGKQLHNVRGEYLHSDFAGVSFEGYEIHCGRSTQLSPNLSNDFLKILSGHNPRVDGVYTQDNQIIGTYLHGIFDKPQSCAVLLKWAGLSSDHEVDINEVREQQLDRLADTLTKHLQPEFLSALSDVESG